VARLLWKFFKVPYIVFAHGEEITVSHANPKLRAKLVPIFDDATAVIANSSFTAQVLRDIGCNGSNIVQISPGVDPVMFSPGEADAELIEKLGLAGKKVLLSVGRLQKRKGHDHVIRALPAVLARHPDVVYVILSIGEEEANLRALAEEMGVADSVRFVGEVPYEDLPRYYRTCDIQIMANRTLECGDVEGFGIVFLEAAACSKPAVAGDSGGTCDPVRDGWNGRRIDASDPENVAATLTELFDDPESWTRMGRNGRAMVEEEYSWDVVCQRVEDVTCEVAAGAFRPIRESVPTP